MKDTFLWCQTQNLDWDMTITPEEEIANLEIIPSDYQGLDLEMESCSGQYTDEPSEGIEKVSLKRKGFQKIQKDKDVESWSWRVDVEEVDVEETKSNETTTKESKKNNNLLII